MGRLTSSLSTAARLHYDLGMSWLVRCRRPNSYEEVAVLVDSFDTRVPGEEGAKITALGRLSTLGAACDVEATSAYEVEVSSISDPD